MSLAFLATDFGKAVLSGVYLGLGDKFIGGEDFLSKGSALRMGVQGVASFASVGLVDAYIAPKLASGSMLGSNILDPVVTGGLYVLGDKFMHYDQSGSLMYRFLLSAGSQALSSYTGDPLSMLFQSKA